MTDKEIDRLIREGYSDAEILQMAENTDNVSVFMDEMKRLIAKLQAKQHLTLEELDFVEKKVLPELPFMTRLLIKGMVEIERQRLIDQ